LSVRARRFQNDLHYRKEFRQRNKLLGFPVRVTVQRTSLEQLYDEIPSAIQCERETRADEKLGTAPRSEHERREQQGIPRAAGPIPNNLAKTI
jgi:hypothetical protein